MTSHKNASTILQFTFGSIASLWTFKLLMRAGEARNSLNPCLWSFSLITIFLNFIQSNHLEHDYEQNMIIWWCHRRGGSRKLWVGGGRVCVNKGETLGRGTKCRAGGGYGRGVSPLPIWKKIKIKDCLDVFWSTPNSTLLCVLSILKEQIFDILWSLTYMYIVMLQMGMLQCKLISWSWLLRTQLLLIGVIGHMWPLMARQNESIK